MCSTAYASVLKWNISTKVILDTVYLKYILVLYIMELKLRNYHNNTTNSKVYIK